MKAVSSGAAPNTGRKRFVPEEGFHYVRVEEDSKYFPQYESPLDSMLDLIDESGDPIYEDLGNIPGACHNKREHLLRMSQERYEAQQRKITRDANRYDARKITAPQNVEVVDQTANANPVSLSGLHGKSEAYLAERGFKVPETS